MKNKVTNIRNLCVNIFTEKKLLEIGLIILFLVQFIITVYFNLFLIESHMGFDSSWSYLKAALIWNEKTLNSDIWVDQTSTFLDSSMPLAAVIYGITGRLFASYGLANMIVLCGILLCISSILRMAHINLKACMFALNLVICPYLVNGFYVENDLGYFSNLISGPAFYSLRALIVLLIIREWLVIRNKQKIDFLGILSIALCALAGVSSGVFIIVMILLPYILYEIESVFIENNYRILLRREAIYGYICLLSVCAGKILAQNILGITVNDVSKTWTPLEKFWTNLSAPILGFMTLLGVLPVSDDSIVVLSKEGIYHLFPMFLFLILILSIAYGIRCIVRNHTKENGLVHFVINIVVTNIFILGLFNANYSSVVFEERYLVCSYMVLIILMAYYIEHLNKKLIFSNFIEVLLFISLIGNDYISDKNYIENTNDYYQMPEILSFVNSQDAKLIYFWGDEINICGRAMRAYDLNHVYKEISNKGLYHHWGDYLYFEDNSDYDGSTLLVIPKDSDIVPDNIINQYTWMQDFEQISIYRCDYNPIDAVSGITGEVNVNYPSSPKMQVQYGEYVGNSYVTDGTAGCVMWGPYCKTYDGTYDFVLNYQILEGSDAQFDVTIDNGTEQLGVEKLNAENAEIRIENITLERNHTLEYRVICGDGTKIRIDKITIIKK